MSLRKIIEICDDSPNHLGASTLENWAVRMREMNVALDRIRALAVDLQKELGEVEDYFDNRMDVDCVGDPPKFVPNLEAHMNAILNTVTRA